MNTDKLNHNIYSQFLNVLTLIRNAIEVQNQALSVLCLPRLRLPKHLLAKTTILFQVMPLFVVNFLTGDRTRS